MRRLRVIIWLYMVLFKQILQFKCTRIQKGQNEDTDPYDEIITICNLLEVSSKFRVEE